MANIKPDDKPKSVTITAPKGLSVTRKKTTSRYITFEATWKIGEKEGYTDQVFHWYEIWGTPTNGSGGAMGGETKHTESVTKKSTSQTFKVDMQKYEPNDNKLLYSIRVEVKAKGKLRDAKGNVLKDKNKHDKEDWSKESKCTYNVKTPDKPTGLKQALVDGTANQVAYSWNIVDKGKERIYYKCQYQYVEKTNFAGDDLDDVSWKNVTKHILDNDHVNLTVSALPSGEDRVTQFFRVREWGPQGASDWVKTCHVFGRPAKAKDVEIDSIKTPDGYLITVEWEAANNKVKYPIDKTVVQYTIQQPVVTEHVSGNKHTFELDCPNSPSWTDRTPTKDTKNVDRLTFSLDGRPAENQVIFVRVNNLHDTTDTTRYGDIHLVDTGGYTYKSAWSPIRLNGGIYKSVKVTIGRSHKAINTLSAPTITSAEFNPNTKKVTINVTNNCGIPYSYTAITANYSTATSEHAKNEIIGIIPHGTSQAILTVADMAEGETVNFSARTYVADYERIYYDSSTNLAEFKINDIWMASEEAVKEGGEIPKAPTVTLSNTSTPGTILVDWKWSWSQATAAEVSWSTDQYAWESTEQPQTFTVPISQKSQIRIPNLEYTRYYVRVRFIKSGDNYETFGIYSDESNYIDVMAADPYTPTLTVEPATVPPNGEFACYWAYTADDGSSQIQAEIAEVFTPDNAPPYSSSSKYEGEDVVIRSSKLYKCKTAIETPEAWNADHWTEVGSVEYKRIDNPNTSTNTTLSVEALKWQAGEEHNIAVRTYSSFSDSAVSDWSDPVKVTIAQPLVVGAVLGTGFTEIIEDGEATGRYELTQFPFTVTVTGTGDDGKTGLYITRRSTYPMNRPDESDIYGYEGETIVLVPEEATGEITIDVGSDTIVGNFDDGEWYDLTVIGSDIYGQYDELDEPIMIRVNWDHKAFRPYAEITIDDEEDIARITPLAAMTEVDVFREEDNIYVEADYVEPEDIGDIYFTFDHGNLIYNYDDDAFIDFDISNSHLIADIGAPSPARVLEGDVVDIYRLSADKPELVYSGDEFGVEVVDPYPALGPFGGYRLVNRTKYNDYITDDGTEGYRDYTIDQGATLDIFNTVIDFGDDRVLLPFNLDLSNTWEKDFTETKYLGGAVQGDWNPAVSRTASISTDVAVEYNTDTFLAMRRLAVYAGVCHVRTPDGSSFAANVSVSESRGDKMISQLAHFSLDITRVDSQKDGDGVLASEYDA